MRGRGLPAPQTVHKETAANEPCPPLPAGGKAALPCEQGSLLGKGLSRILENVQRTIQVPPFSLRNVRCQTTLKLGKASTTLLRQQADSARNKLVHCIFTRLHA